MSIGIVVTKTTTFFQKCVRGCVDLMQAGLSLPAGRLAGWLAGCSSSALCRYSAVAGLSDWPLRGTEQE